MSKINDGIWIALAILIVGFAYIFHVAKPAQIAKECEIAVPKDAIVAAGCIAAGGAIQLWKQSESERNAWLRD